MRGEVATFSCGLDCQTLAVVRNPASVGHKSLPTDNVSTGNSIYRRERINLAAAIEATNQRDMIIDIKTPGLAQGRQLEDLEVTGQSGKREWNVERLVNGIYNIYIKLPDGTFQTSRLTIIK